MRVKTGSVVHLFFGLVVGLCAFSARADEVCAALGVPGGYQLGSGTCNQFAFPNPIITAIDQAKLLGRVITVAVRQENEIKQLRAELKVSTDALTLAVNALNAATAKFALSNADWQKQTLATTLNRIDQMPGKLATEKALYEPLSVIVGDALSKDAAFIAKLKSAP